MENKTLKYYTIVLDGIDKSGKDTIAKFIWNLDKRLNVFVRGWPSLVVYAEKFNRNCSYELPYKNAIYVRCDVDKIDWLIRCKMTNEQDINYEYDSNLFNKAFYTLLNNNYYVLHFNTSKLTPYDIATQIVQFIKNLNKEN